MSPARKKKPAPVVLDVRDDLARGQDPFHRIMQTVDGLAPDQELHLIAPFQPLPLLAVMRRRGFNYQMQPRSDGAWEVHFRPDPYAGAACEMEAPTPRGGDAPVLDDEASEPSPRANVERLDVRGLMPPEPLVRVLERLNTLPAGAVLIVQTDQRPVHLLAALEERGYTGESIEQPDGSCLTHIRRR